MIRNKKTGQIYIGQSKNIENRFRGHCKVQKIDIAIATEGVENFDFIVLEELNEERLNDREKYWINYYNSDNDIHYNQNPGGHISDYIGYGQNALNKKYTLWDISCCQYEKSRYLCKRENIVKCFRFKYKGCRLAIGMFYDFLSCEIIADLIEKSI